jgi:hypothetical protein
MNWEMPEPLVFGPSLGDAVRSFLYFFSMGLLMEKIPDSKLGV